MDKDLNTKVGGWLGEARFRISARDKLAVATMQGHAPEDHECSGSGQCQGHQPATRVAPTASRQSIEQLADKVGILDCAGEPQLPNCFA
jgi:hypothetical protein